MYYGSKLSDNMSRMPEGYLCCLNVPIGRTGVQEYLGQEIGLEYGSRYQVIRDETEVFSVTAIASFEGKPFTDEHPPDEVTTDNVNRYLKGVVKNVRRGQGEQSDLLLADILVYDEAVIREIEAGKREVSCGYNCLYEPAGEGRLKQTGIIGNHVALVQKGRAGSRVAIKDESPEKRRDRRMEKQTKNSVWGKIMQAFAKDATPEEMELAVDEMMKACGDEEPSTPEVKEQPAADEGATPNPLEARLDRLEVAVGKLVQALGPKEDPDALDALEAELHQQPAAENTDEESVTVEPEAVNKPEVAAADHAVLLQQIGTLKPIVAQIADPVQRKQTADTLAAILRSGTGRGVTGGNQGYLDVYQAAMAQVDKQRKTADAAADERALGREIAKKYNPHYKEEQ